MLRNTPVVTHRQRGRVDETDAGTRPIATSQVGTQRHQYRRDEFDKARVADQLRELVSQIHLHILGVVGLEIAVSHLMKMDQKGHDLARIQLSRSPPLFEAALQ